MMRPASCIVSPPLLLCNQILAEYLNMNMKWKQNVAIINEPTILEIFGNFYSCITFKVCNTFLTFYISKHLC